MPYRDIDSKRTQRLETDPTLAHLIIASSPAFLSGQEEASSSSSSEAMLLTELPKPNNLLPQTKLNSYYCRET